MIRIALLLISLAGPCAAQDASAQLRDAAEKLQAATTATDRIAALTDTVRAYETGLSVMRAQARDIALDNAMLRDELHLRRQSFSQLLGMLSTIERAPQPVLQTHPGGPVAALRAGMLVADVTLALETELSRLTSLMGQANQIAAAQATAMAQLRDGLSGAQAARTALALAVSERRDLPERFVDDPVQTALLVAGAQTLDDFTAGLATRRASGNGDTALRGGLPLPVKGRVQAATASDRPGWHIAAVPRALVTAPASGTVLFAGPLLDYGTVVIYEPAPDVLFVMAGFADVLATVGRVLPAGAPIGLLPAQSGPPDGILTENQRDPAGQFATALYLEVREGQTVVDPNQWFAPQ